MKRRRNEGTRQQIVEETFNAIASVDLHEVFSFLKPERLADGAGFSASAVRSHFSKNRNSEQFDRAQLGFAVIELAIAAIEDAARSNIDQYRMAIAAMRREPQAAKAVLLAALNADMDDYEVGDADELVARERLFYLGLAVCDKHPKVRSIYRGFWERANEEFQVAFWRDLLTLTQREIAEGSSLEALDNAYTAMQEGYALQRRFRDISDGEVEDALVRVIWAHTAPVGVESPDPLNDLVTALRSSPPPGARGDASISSRPSR